MRVSLVSVGAVLALALTSLATVGADAGTRAARAASYSTGLGRSVRVNAWVENPPYLWASTAMADQTGIHAARSSRPRLEGGTPAPRMAPVDYKRADAETIRAQVRDILSDPRFGSHKTFMQWLGEKLRKWGGPNLPQGLKEVLLWVVLVWCILTLLAIFAHLVWSIWLLVRPQKGSAAPELPGGLEGYENASFEQLWERSAELARAGAFRAAVGVLLVAVLRRLDTLKVLHFHKSKTNGEYVREYPSRLVSRRPFVQFITAFERTVYGGSDVAAPTYDSMSTLAQQVLSDASQEPQI